MKKREIPKKNYIMLAVICIFSVCIVWYFATWYRTTKGYRIETSVIADMIPEINSKEISNYILDNSNMMIYIASSKNENNTEFEKELKNVILDKEISSEIVFLDKDKVKDSKFYTDMASEYYNDDLKKKGVSLEYTPNIVVFENGEIVDVLNTTNAKIEKKDIEKFLNSHVSGNEE